MDIFTEFGNIELVQILKSKILEQVTSHVRLMEVCGGHTTAIQKFGIRSLLPPDIELISGPGCPVCVSEEPFIDKVIAISSIPEVTICTFGDLIRVPGSYTTLEKQKSIGADIRIIYSAIDALNFAKANTNRLVVFPAIGFETTAPGTAATILRAEKEKIENFLVLSAHKYMPPAMEALIDDEAKIDGYIAPGHVSTIIGSEVYSFIPVRYGIPVVVAGFEPVDLLQSVYLLVEMIRTEQPRVKTQYSRAVQKYGNETALRIMDTVFEKADAEWRGLGIIKQSGMRIRKEYQRFDANEQFNVQLPELNANKGCLCGMILKGRLKPVDCPLFKNKCTPSTPVGPCMVSGEGTCQAYYRYQNSA